jgi:hypothetical protein
MKRRLVLIFICFFAVGICIKMLTTIYAQNSNPGLVIYPSNFDLTYNNEPISDKITFLNNTNQDITIRVDVKNFTPLGEEGGANLTEENNNFSLASWITVTPQTISIPAKKQEIFTFTITPPKKAEPGGHFGSIVFATIPSNTIKGTAGASISQEIAALILFKIPGNANEKAYIEELVADKNFYEFGPIQFSVRVKNIGDIHIIPVGSLVVKGTFGDSHYANLIPRTVLPNSVRKIPATLSDTFLFGKYHASIVATYGTHNQQLYGSTSFYVFPIRYVAIGSLIILILFLMRYRLFKALKAIVTGK